MDTTLYLDLGCLALALANPAHRSQPFNQRTMDAVRQRLKSFDFVKVDRTGRVGVTTFYRQYFRRSKPFVSPVKYPKKKGLQIGRITDLNLRTYADTGRLPRRSEIGNYIHNVAAACKQHGLVVVRAQVPVAAGPIHTQLDALAVSKSGEIVVIELKCTQQTRTEHRTNYSTPCTSLAKLQHSGLPNTEKNAHAWQCGYGVVAFRETYPEFNSDSVVGCVIVACRDGSFLYRSSILPDMAELPANCAAAPEPTPELSMFKASKFEFGGPLIDELIHKNGFANLRRKGVLLAATAPDKTDCLFGILPSFKSCSKERRLKAVDAIKRARGKKRDQRCFVVHRTDSGWSLALVGKRSALAKR